MQEELDHLREAVTLWLDVSGTTFQQILNLLSRALGLGEEAPSSMTIQALLQRAWNEAALHGKTLFIHFDEAGALSDENMRRLRDQLRAVLRHWCIRYQKDPSIPRVHFYLSGRGGALIPLGDSSSSPIATARIVLQQLLPQHIGDIREHLMKHGGLDFKVWAAPSVVRCQCSSVGTALTCMLPVSSGQRGRRQPGE